ncbi:MAG: integrase core domain-containing protein [Tannerella sp.]|nr:integrase core domain-containing protein [Tannerella sp.]
MKLWHMYRKLFSGNRTAGRDRFENIVNRYGLKVRAKMRQPRITDSTHGLPVYPNIIKDFIPCAVNQLRVSDITYITVWRNEYSYLFCCLSLILDAYSEEIIGRNVGTTLETAYPAEALRKAFKRVEGQDEIRLIRHPDRGCRYASNEYVSILKRHGTGIGIGMTGSGNPKDNAQAERINGTMKNELLKGVVFRSMDEVKAAVTVAADFYNNDNERPHMRIDMMTPSGAAGCTGEIAKQWKSSRHDAVKSLPEGLNIAGNGLPLPDYRRGSRAMPSCQPEKMQVRPERSSVKRLSLLETYVSAG